MAQPMKLVVIGGGPSAFYVASRLLSLLPAASSSPTLSVHLYDRLWAPHGLVRYGVAPDHPEVKNCTHKFDDAALDPRLRFFGNVNVDLAGLSAGIHIPHAVSLPFRDLLSHYTHVLFATGCALPTLHPVLPVIPQRSIPALSMVHWYTSHPSQANQPPPVDLSKISHVTLIGQGNVSLDVARMLLMPPSVLSSYDVPAPVLEELSRSKVKHVSIIGRRGPMQAAFTTKELREMINLPDSSMVPLDPALCVPPTGLTVTRQQSRTLQLLEKGSKNKFGSTDKTWGLEFFRSPKSLDIAGDKLQIELQHNTVDPKTLRAIPIPQTSSLETDLVISALGFHSESIDPAIFGAPSSPLLAAVDTKPSTALKALRSRVLSPSDPSRVLKNVYASGWAANGARGVLASTMMDAYAVADVILSDWLPKSQPTTSVPAPSSPTGDLPDAVEGTVEITNASADPESLPDVIAQGLKNGEVVEYAQWKRIDAEEIARGQKANGKERERMSWEEARRFVL